MPESVSSIRKIHELLTSRNVSCVELTERYLNAIAEENPRLNAYVTVTADEARSAAARTDAKLARGHALGLLEGIPMNLKDNISTEGIQTTCSSRILEGYVPIYNATAWRRLKEAGAVMLGKTNMDEFAMGSTTRTSCFGGSVNPLDPARVPGGSSGGLASSVGGSLAVYGLGSDTGGSIRQPASFCGLVGLKPTYGAVSRYGLIAYASSLDQIGIIATGTEDVAAAFSVIAGYDRMDATSRNYSYKFDPSDLESGVKGLKIGIPDEYFEDIRPDVKERVMDAAKVLERCGAELVRVKLPAVKYALPVYYILSCAEASSNLARYDGVRYGRNTDAGYTDFDEMICRTRDEGFGPEAKRRIMLGTYVLSSGYYDAYYRKAQNLRVKVAADFNRAFAQADILLTPTVPVTALKAECEDEDPVHTYMTDICTVPVNIAGLPALSMPCGLCDDGLPAGAQLIGRHFSEEILLRAAFAHERNVPAGIYGTAGMGVRL